MVDLNIILYITIPATIILSIVFFILQYKQKKDAMPNLMKHKKRKEVKEKISKVVYNVLTQTPLLKDYVNVIEFAYMRICPYDKPTLVRLITETMIISFIGSVITGSGILILNIVINTHVTVFALCCTVLMIYATCIEILNFRIRRTQERISQDLVLLISNIKHHYLVHHNVAQALIAAADGMSHEINLHANQLYSILISADRERAVLEYVANPRANKYMKMFLSQAFEASEKGDALNENGESTFLYNLEFLRIEIMQDSFNMLKQNYKLQGYSLVILLPVMAMPIIKLWGMDFEAEMKTFYSQTGHFIEAVTLAATFLIYRSVNKTRDMNFSTDKSSLKLANKIFKNNIATKRLSDSIENHKGKFFQHIRFLQRETGDVTGVAYFCFKSVVFVVVVTSIMFFFFQTLHLQNMNYVITEVNNIDSIVSIATEKQKVAIVDATLKMTNDYLKEKKITSEELLTVIDDYVFITNDATKLAICNEVVRRIQSYHNSFIQWYEILISFGVGLASCVFPYFGLKYKYNLILQSRGKEVQTFQSILIMERLFPSITTVELLENLEAYALYFKSIIRECINTYSIAPRASLLKLKNSTDFQDFRDLCDEFLAIEEVGVKEAFGELVNNRDMSGKLTELNINMVLDKKQDSTDLLSMIPAGLAVGVYFVLPFAISVLDNIGGMFSLLDTLNKM